MVKVNILRGKMAEKGLSQEDVAKTLNISIKTLQNHFKRGVFNSNEIYGLIQLLDIDDPCDVFFAPNAT